MVNCPPSATTKHPVPKPLHQKLVQFTVAPRSPFADTVRVWSKASEPLTGPSVCCKAQCSDVKGKHVQPDDQRSVIRDDQRLARRSTRFVAKVLVASDRRGTKVPAETGSDGLEEFEDRPSS